MLALALLLMVKLAHCEEDDDDDFWNSLADDEVVVDDKVEGRLYDKARFNLPLRRRLRLYPEIQKTYDRVQGKSRLEFIYEAKTPQLVFLDSSDVTVETIDISKMSYDEIFALLNLRGFAEITDEAESVLEPFKEDDQAVVEEAAKDAEL